MNTPEQAVIQAALLPCPFCGKDPIVVSEDRVWIECPDCPSKAEVGPFNTEAEAITAWNTRLAHSQPASVGLREALEEVYRRMTVLISENEEVLTTTVQRHVVAAHEVSRAALQPLTEPRRRRQHSHPTHHREERVMSWQPIETAPKDGTFLGWNVDDEICEVWSAKSFHRAKGAWPRLKATGDGDPHQLILGVQASAVSHWMPLPEAPTPGAQS